MWPMADAVREQSGQDDMSGIAPLRDLRDGRYLVQWRYRHRIIMNYESHNRDRRSVSHQNLNQQNDLGLG
jgi:hypothetical protein